MKYEKLQNELIGAEALLNQLNDDKQTEIEIATIEINKKYASKENEANLKVNEVKNKLQKYQNDIIMYATFNHELIGNALAYLIKIFDGLDFVYETGAHLALHTNFTPIYEKYVDERYDAIKMLIKKEMKNPSRVYKDPELGKNIIEAYFAQKEVIVLEELNPIERFKNKKHDGPKITFYNIYNNKFVLNVDFNGFTYLENFINYVIEYRYNNNLKEFSNEDMKNLIVTFINMNKNEINARHYERLNNQVKSLTL